MPRLVFSERPSSLPDLDQKIPGARFHTTGMAYLRLYMHVFNVLP